MKLFFYEWLKLLQRRVLWLLIAALFFTNGILLVREITDHENGYSLQEVRMVYDDWKQAAETEQMEWLAERAGSLTAQMMSQQYDMSEYPYETYTETCVQETLLISHVQEQTQEAWDYESYLDYVQEQADQLTGLTVFASPDTFSYRNMQKTKEVYQNLEGVQTKIDISDGVRLLTDYRWTDIWLLLAMVILLLGIFVSEREEGLLSLIKPAKYGYAATIWAKIAVMISAAVPFTIFFYGTNVLFAGKMVGFGDISRSIQSLYGYSASAMHLSVGAYMICFFAAKAVAVMAVCSVLALLSVITRSGFYTILFFSGLSAVEILLWKQIDSHSWLWPFSQFNLASALDVGHYFAAYENLNFFGWPVNHMFVIGVMSVGSIMICMLWTARRFCTEQTSGAGKMLGFYRKSKKQSVSRTYTNGFRTYTSGSGAHTIDSEVHTSGCGIHAIGWRIHTNLWRHETFKLLITGKGLLLLILLGALQFGSYYDRTYYTTAEEYEYHTYSESLEGKLYWRKEIFLKEEKERFAENEQQLADLYAQYEAGEISLAALEQYENRLKISDAKKAALEQTVTQYITLLEYEEKGENVEYIEQTGWDKLLGTNGRHERLGNAGKLLLFLSMAVLVYTLMDDASGVNVLQRISAVGSRALMWRKLAVCGGYAFALAALAFWPQILSVWHRFGMTLPNVSAHSILALSGIPVALPLRIWFLFFLFGKPAGAAVYAWLLLLGVERMRKIIKKY